MQGREGGGWGEWGTREYAREYHVQYSMNSYRETNAHTRRNKATLQKLPRNSEIKQTTKRPRSDSLKCIRMVMNP